MKSGRGGIRENAGRKTGWVSGRGFDRTKIIRVPIEFAEQLLQIAHKLDAGEAIDSVTETENELNPDLLLAKELVTESLERAMVDFVTKSKEELTLFLPLDKGLVTKSVEQLIIDLVKEALSRWRQRSDEAKITSPKSERWANARKILNELELIVFGVALQPKEVETEVTAIAPSLSSQQNDIVTKSEKYQLSDLVTESITASLEQLELVTETKVFDLEEVLVQSSNQLNLLGEAEYQASSSEPKTAALVSLTRIELAERLGIKVESLGNRITGKMASTFSEWSKKRDPDGITWQYYPETKLFFPLPENVTKSKLENMSGKGDITT